MSFLLLYRQVGFFATAAVDRARDTDATAEDAVTVVTVARTEPPDSIM